MEQNIVKRIPYGVSDFVKVMEQDQYYVDKTVSTSIAGLSLIASWTSTKNITSPSLSKR